MVHYKRVSDPPTHRKAWCVQDTPDSRARGCQWRLDTVESAYFFVCSVAAFDAIKIAYTSPTQRVYEANPFAVVAMVRLSCDPCFGTLDDTTQIDLLQPFEDCRERLRSANWSGVGAYDGVNSAAAAAARRYLNRGITEERDKNGYDVALANPACHRHGTVHQGQYQ